MWRSRCQASVRAGSGTRNLCRKTCCQLGCLVRSSNAVDVKIRSDQNDICVLIVEPARVGEGRRRRQRSRPPIRHLRALRGRSPTSPKLFASPPELLAARPMCVKSKPLAHRTHRRTWQLRHLRLEPDLVKPDCHRQSRHVSLGRALVVAEQEASFPQSSSPPCGHHVQQLAEGRTCR